MQKKLLLLGGSRYLIPAIKAAHDLGAYVITCDYLPDNYAHKLSDEYHNVSIIEKEAVLDLAQKLQIDGIMSYATDPGVATAAYVAEKMGLPGNNPYESVAILQNKGRFRAFLRDHGFNVPQMMTYKSWEAILPDLKKIQYPVIVKPTDSAGSKGVTRVDCEADLQVAVQVALNRSIGKECIIEEFIEKKGFSTDTDSFSVDGNLVFFSLNDQWFDDNAANIYTPAAYSWPSTMPEQYQTEIKNEVQRLLKLLHMGTSIYNIETRIGSNGKAYIMEVSPRAGGNRLAEMLRYACGQDLIKASVQGALGLPIDTLSQPVYQGYWGLAVLHSEQEGIYQGITFDKKLKDKIVEKDLWVQPGDKVEPFTGANESMGTLVLHCSTHDELVQCLQHIQDFVNIKVKG
jgi:biotin carboxylase